MDIDTFLNFAIVFLVGSLVGVLAMIARDAWDERMEDAEDY